MGRLNVYVDCADINVLSANKTEGAQDNPLKNIDAIAQTVYKVLKQKTNLYAELDFVSKEEIQEINRDNRHIDAVTDVLSFPMLDNIRGKTIFKKDFPFDYDQDEKAVFLGSICICIDRAKEQAEEFGHSVQREMSYLFVHGLLHLFGYDHMVEADKTQMREKEEQVLLQLGISR